MTVRQRLGAQNQKPTGVLGWAAAGLMLVEGPSGCRHQAVAELLDLQPGDALLDIACGSGLFLRRRAMHVQRVAGLDHSSVQISLARRLLRQRVDRAVCGQRPSLIPGRHCRCGPRPRRLDAARTAAQLRLPTSSDAGVPIEKIARLVGHTGTTTTETVYRKQIRPVVTGGAEITDSLFPRRDSDT